MLKANLLSPLPHKILSIQHLSEQKKTMAFVSVSPDTHRGWYQKVPGIQL
jgi:hypothetical protein